MFRARYQLEVRYSHHLNTVDVVTRIPTQLGLGGPLIKLEHQHSLRNGKSIISVKKLSVNSISILS